MTRILVAEDERITRRSLQRELESWGHEVVVAEDGAAAWDRFEAEEFDIVVTDWDMPRLDGAGLVQRVRASDRPGYVYLIMLTGRSEKSDIVAGMDAGADDYLAKPFDRDELRVRVRAGERIIQLERALAVRNTQLHSANERMRHDLDAAAKIQRDLLPSALPEMPGVRFAWHYQPCDELAGDLLNIVPIDEHRVAMYIADVSGHGVAASLVAVAVHRSLSLRRDGTSLLVTEEGDKYVSSPPARVASQLNAIYPMESNGGHFLTLGYAVVDTERSQMRFCCAGHPGPIVLRRGAAPHSLDSSGLPVGVIPDAEYDKAEIDLQEGDRIYLYSDGVTEAANDARELFGLERLERVIADSRGATLQESVDAIMDAAARWQANGRFGDDVSVVAVEFKAG
jgi:sigma-B regulation protein RsbU (phosphoserine phosphatase)